MKRLQKSETDFVRIQEGMDMTVVDPDRWPLLKLYLEMKIFCGSVPVTAGLRLVVQPLLHSCLHNPVAQANFLGGNSKFLVAFTFLSLHFFQAEQEAADIHALIINLKIPGMGSHQTIFNVRIKELCTH